MEAIIIIYLFAGAGAVAGAGCRCRDGADSKEDAFFFEAELILRC